MKNYLIKPTAQQTTKEYVGGEFMMLAFYATIFGVIICQM